MKQKAQQHIPVVLVLLLFGGSSALAGVISPRHRIYQATTTVAKVPVPIESATRVVAPIQHTFVTQLPTDVAFEVLTPGEAIEKVQDLIESLILDDSIEADTGNGLLESLDDVLDFIEDDRAAAADELAKVQDDVSQGVADGNIDANAGKFVAGSVDGILDML